MRCNISSTGGAYRDGQKTFFLQKWTGQNRTTLFCCFLGRARIFLGFSILFIFKSILEIYSVVVLYAYNTIKILYQAFFAKKLCRYRLKMFWAKVVGRQIFGGKIGRATKKHSYFWPVLISDPCM